MFFRRPKFASGLTLTAFVLLAFGLGLTVFSTQQRQDNRSQAAWTGGSCNLQGQSSQNCCSNVSHIVGRTGWQDVAGPGTCIDVNTQGCNGRLVPTNIWLCPGGNNIICCVPIKAPTATPTKKPTATPTKKPTATPTKKPTATPTPSSTTLSFDLLFHGIGKGGDNRNPNGGGNPNPQHPTRSVVVDVYDLNDNLLVTKQGSVAFDPVSGSYKGNVVMGSALTSGARVIKVKLSHSLRGTISRNITAGTTNVIPVTRLVNGDTNNDARLDILDYNIILGCYSDFDLPPADCDATRKAQADIDDDGQVNQFDLNLFLREMSVQQI